MYTFGFGIFFVSYKVTLFLLEQVQELSAQIAVVVAGIAQIEYRGVAAMELLGLAKRTFDIAGTIYNSTFNTSFRSNNAELNHTQSVIQGKCITLILTVLPNN